MYIERRKIEDDVVNVESLPAPCIWWLINPGVTVGPTHCKAQPRMAQIQNRADSLSCIYNDPQKIVRLA